MVLVTKDFLETKHGQISCTSCHKGNKDADNKLDAHKNIVSQPSNESETYCKPCHTDIANNHSSSLHANLQGYTKRIEARSGIDITKDSTLMSHYNKDCNVCHASCGQCHVSRPVSVKGGFIDGHNFKKTPNQTNNCIACHGARIGPEYLGETEQSGVSADVHRIPKFMKCVDCHTDTEMHGTGDTNHYRYVDNNMPRCENCHTDTKESNKYHKTHWEGNSNNFPSLSCQVCHSQVYKNCNSCHAGADVPLQQESYFTFKIAKNPLTEHEKSISGRNYDFVPVRHVPVVKATYANWGISNLDNYDSLPTWRYATPHNIRKRTPQTDTNGTSGSCSKNCHGTDNYLTSEDFTKFGIDSTEEINANKRILMDSFISK